MTASSGVEVLDWGAFSSAAPELARIGRERLHGRVAYLATVRADGSPRVHPLTPILSKTALYVFMEPTSPKGHDLRRDARFALHAGVEDLNGGAGEFIVRGRAFLVDEAVVREAAIAASPYAPAERYILFELRIDHAMLTTYGPSGPQRQQWDAARSEQQR